MEYDKAHVSINTIRQCTVFNDKAVLEIGCGQGKASSFLATGTRTYTGIDPDHEAIKTARENHGHVDFRIGTGESLEFDDASFDIVLFTLSLHHHHDCGRALDQAHRVLKDSGTLIITEPAVEGEFQQFFHLFNDETDQIQAAYNSIQNSRFRMIRQDRYHAIAEFGSLDALLTYPFDRDTVQPEDARRIKHLLSTVQTNIPQPDQPVCLTDTIHIYCMSKKGNV